MRGGVSISADDSVSCPRLLGLSGITDIDIPGNLWGGPPS